MSLIKLELKAHLGPHHQGDFYEARKAGGLFESSHDMTECPQVSGGDAMVEPAIKELS